MSQRRRRRKALAERVASHAATAAAATPTTRRRPLSPPTKAYALTAASAVAVAIAVAGAAVAFVALNRADVGGLAVQVTVTLLVLVAFFVVSLVVVTARIERERDGLRRDVDVLQRRAFVQMRIGEIALAVKLEGESSGPDEDAKLLRRYADQALSAARSDPFANVGRINELESFLEVAPGEARKHLVKLEKILHRRIYEASYLRP